VGGDRISPEARSLDHQKIVVRYKEIEGICVQNIEKKVKPVTKYSLDLNNTIFPTFPTQMTLDFFVAEQCGLRNTIFWWS
jgi:hypothetical protein